MTPSSEPQSAGAVLMVRPYRFGWNGETAASNTYQLLPSAPAHEVHQQALREFEGLRTLLIQNGVSVLLFDDLPEPATPDSLFPNNWFSTHGDGTLVLYPMAALSRRAERRPQLIDALRRRAPALLVGYVVPFLVVFAPYLLWRHWYYGEWVPNTFFAKSGAGSLLPMGWVYVRDFFACYWPLLLAPLPVLWFLVRKPDAHELLITHNFVIAWFVREVLDAPDWRWMTINQAHCGLTVLSQRPGRPRSMPS